jgi:competence ComEA-like helix-hairpin-helix protein
MNRFFEFSTAQIKTLTVLALLLVAGGGYLLVRDYYFHQDPRPRFWRVETIDEYRPSLVLDLNPAPADSLELIPGIGPALAGRIVSFRQANGPFAVVESLVHVPGIGPAVMEKVKPYLRTSVP